MGLHTQTIGKTMTHGYAGSYSRQPDSVIDTHAVLSGDSGILFGTAVVYANGGTVALPKSDSTAADFVGVVVREVKSATDFLNQNEGKYYNGEAAPVMKRGCVNVICQKGTPTIGGAVYLRIKVNEGYPNAVIGGFEAEADDTNTVKLTNCQWSGGADTNRVAEMRILTMINA